MKGNIIFGRRAVLAALLCFVPIGSVLRAQFRSEGLSVVQPFPANALIAEYAIVSATPADVPVSVPLAFPSGTAVSEPGHKSSFLAAALSLAVPGLGELYVGDDLWRGLVFTGLEAGLWIEWAHWNVRGNDTDIAFQNFSNAHWSTIRYADTLDTLLAHFGVSDSSFANGTIASINRAERLLDSIDAGNPVGDDYGHQLVDPTVDNQQYYEMISKYNQYLSGWDNLANFNQASLSRAELNAEYDVANIFLYGIILNHVLSAIDAAILARNHNSALRLHGDVIVQPLPNGTLGYVPAAKIEYRF